MSNKKDKNARKKAVKKKLILKKQKAKLYQQLKAMPEHEKLGYSITWEPLFDEDNIKLPEKIAQRKEYIFNHLAKTPEKFIGELTDLVNEYPEDKGLGNFLVAAHQYNGQSEVFEKEVRAQLARHPKYLFALTQMAELYIKQDEYEQVYQLFGCHFDLKLLYPERNVFHVSEVSATHSIAGRYYAWSGDKEKLLHSYLILSEIAPDSPATFTLMTEIMSNNMQGLLSP